MTGIHTLFIPQYIFNKSKDQVTAPFLRDGVVWDYHVLAVQEPWRNSFQTITHHPIPDRFDLVYHVGGRTRVCFFVNRRLLG